MKKIKCDCGQINKVSKGYNFLYCSKCGKKLFDYRNQF